MRCLVVGQGIAGAILAWTLRKAGVKVTVSDAGFPHQSSSIAAGIVNPITGKRYVKSWRFDAHYSVAKRVYQAMEAEWGVPLWHEQALLRMLNTPEEVNNWSLRMAEPEYAGLMSERKVSDVSWAGLLKEPLVFGEVRRAARVDFGAIMAQLRAVFQAEGRFLEGALTPEDILRLAPSYDAIICCEGYRGKDNPLFPGLAWQLSKGEAFLIRIQRMREGQATEMLKKTILLAPLGDGLCWAGATYNWTFDDNGPTEPEGRLLERHLQAVLDCSYTIVHKMGGIRPTVKDRRPFLGVSPTESKIFVFNGLGTKGALLAPFWADHLAEHLLRGVSLDPEVDIRRFYS